MTGPSAANPVVLSSSIRQGILNLPGTTPKAKHVAERVLEEDRRKHHCFRSSKTPGLNNHLSHHLLAAYDLGAPAALLQKIYNGETESQADIETWERANGKIEAVHETITNESWTGFLGDERYYASYLAFFTNAVAQLGPGEALEKYVFAPAANEHGAHMLLRFVGGAMHPLIQTGYATEFGSDAMIAQALAQIALTDANYPKLFDMGDVPAIVNEKTKEPYGRQPHKGCSLLSILCQAYDSDAMKPVMPYDPNVFISARMKSAFEDGTRVQEICRLSSLWQIDPSRGEAEFDEKIEELFWTATLLLVGTGRPGRKPRLDFFFMHILNACLFLPSLLQAIPTTESKVLLFRAIVPVLLAYLTVRGRPRINPELAMSYTEFPRPPNFNASESRSDAAIGDMRDPQECNSWPTIVSDVIHAPDAHTVKAIRTLYYAAQKYGLTMPGEVIGALDTEGRETHLGIGKVDGTLFVRAAGVVMDTLGWVAHGEKEGEWDSSALGWDDAWKGEDAN